MTELMVRVSDTWLRLREPADAEARSRGLARAAGAGLGTGNGSLVAHDLGSGNGSMGRWFAPLLRGPQHWVLHDRDPDLLAVALGTPPIVAADGAPVTVEVQHGDLTELRDDDLAGASLVTASALLDVLTSHEVDSLVRRCVTAGCPALLTLSVTGRVRLSPADPLDHLVAAAFDDHQRRTTGGRTHLGPGAAAFAAGRFRSHGHRVTTRPSPWRLDVATAALLKEWLLGWVGAACEQRPELEAPCEPYLERRLAELAKGRLRVTVAHVDLLARPRGGER